MSLIQTTARLTMAMASYGLSERSNYRDFNRLDVERIERSEKFENPLGSVSTLTMLPLIICQ